MSVHERPKPIPGASPGEVISDKLKSNGQCPVCSSAVVWAADKRENLDGSTWHAPLEPGPVAVDYGSGGAFAILSTSGQVAVVEPMRYRLHICPPEAVEEMLRRVGGLGYYTAEILGTSCPVRSCGAAPGMLCISQRREVFPRPHGARTVVSRGEELDDPTF